VAEEVAGGKPRTVGCVRSGNLACPDRDHEETEFVAIDLDARAPSHALKVSGGGTRIPGSVSNGRVTATMNLTSQRE